ncbi:MAG: Gfo/Idh/MocA family oxidoreductase [Clostridia bacterium]|nr:Gfo/Idh/MocA family oxidoreductase [Clostridia bacterium]
MRKMKIGFVGVGDISGIYLENLTKSYKEVEIAGVCDLVREKAGRAVKKYGIPKLYGDMYELFEDKEVDIVLNITRPDEHYEVTKAALLAGKNVYSEKPLATSLEKGKELVALAKERGLALGGAPDTFLGAAIQTAREMIDRGDIGGIVGAAGYMKCRGHESWHPDPEFYYKRGGGPMLDMGPYYVTAFVNLFGSVKWVTSMSRITYPERMITSEPKAGQVIKVDVPTHVSGVMEFENGAIGTLTTSFDVFPAGSYDLIEVYGSEGSMIVPDPNNCGGKIRIRGKGDWEERDLTFDYGWNCRGLGLCDMANAIRDGRTPRANCGLTYHALEVMLALANAEGRREHVKIESRCDRTAPMCRGLEEGILD